MTQEDKQLLLKDLSARLSCGVYIENAFYGSFGKVIKVKEQLNPEHLTILYNDIYNDENWHSNSFKPYLRPMDSMTDEEREEFRTLIFPEASCTYEDCLEWDAQIIGGGYLQISVEDFSNVTDWLNAHHFDYRGLIGKGLAIEASEGMYKTK